MHVTVKISKSLVDEFWALWSQGEYKGQRLGQAFFNHFYMHRMTEAPANLYEATESEARSIIQSLTDFTQ